MTVQKYITWSKMNVKEKLEQSSSILALQHVSLSSCVTLPSIRFRPPRRDTVLVADALVSHCCCISKCCCCCCMLLLLFFYLHGAIISTAITAVINSTATDRSVRWWYILLQMVSTAINLCIIVRCRLPKQYRVYHMMRDGVHIDYTYFAMLSSFIFHVSNDNL